jgi:hypothetical protein
MVLVLLEAVEFLLLLVEVVVVLLGCGLFSLRAVLSSMHFDVLRVLSRQTMHLQDE